MRRSRARPRRGYMAIWTTIGDEKKLQEHCKIKPERDTVHVRKYPLISPAKAKCGKPKQEKQQPIHTLLDVVVDGAYIVPNNLMELMAYKDGQLRPNLTRLRRNLQGEIVDVKVCLECSEAECAANHNCPAKAEVQEFILTQAMSSKVTK